MTEEAPIPDATPPGPFAATAPTAVTEDGEDKTAKDIPDPEAKETQDVDTPGQVEESQTEDNASVTSVSSVAIDNRLPYKARPIIPEARYYNYEGFMNRMDGDEDFVIEVLITNSDWHEDVITERGKREQRESSPQETDPHKDKTKSASSRQLKLARGSKTRPDEGRIMRIRVTSETVLDALASCSGCFWLDHPGIGQVFEFNRPFRILEEFHEDMERRLAEMEAEPDTENNEPGKEKGEAPETKTNAADKEQENDSHGGTESIRDQAVETVGVEQAGASPDATKDEVQAEGKEEDTKPLRKTALEEMKCFIDFVKQSILPIRRTFQEYGIKSRPRVGFQDIPYLFQPGSLVFLAQMPQQAKSGRTLHRSAAQQIWRMAFCQPAWIYTYPSDDKLDREDSEDFFATKLSLYCLDYDGDAVVPVWTTVEIELFWGERDITSLPCYPLAFHPDQATILEKQGGMGKKFLSCVSGGFKHLYYSGWTFITGLRAEPLEDDKGNQIQYPEHVESEVVVDFKETLQNYPKWATETDTPTLPSTGWNYHSYPELNFRVWEEYPTGSNDTRRYRLGESNIIVHENELYRREADKYMEGDKLISGQLAPEYEAWTEQDLALLPKRVFGYILRERRFARLDLNGLETDKRQKGVTLADIQMKESRRKMIRSAVSAHFRGKRGLSTFDLDVIRGKGKGLVILLHGAPGVGKTATAEAVAVENGRPLFPITCGDLGFSPSAVDKSLRDIFRYAHLWDCILLFDEADVFLTQRDRSSGHLEHNALVGVFLRVLEYYSGILFLTTNRPGALDEAFRSRVHLSLYYPNLSLDDTVEILRANLSRLPRFENAEDKTVLGGCLKVSDKAITDFVKTEYVKYSRETGQRKGPWNGRQIRNAVQIAAGLALYDKETEVREQGDDGTPAYLTVDHFRAVSETTTEFEEYLKVTKAADEARLAYLRADRADHFRDEDYEEHEAYEGHSDTDRWKTPQRNRNRGSASSRMDGQRLGLSAPGMPERSRSSNSRRPEASVGKYPASPRAFPSPGSGRGQLRARGARAPRRSQEPEFDEDCDEDPDNGQDYFPGEEEEEHDEWEQGRRPPPTSRGGRPSPFGRRSNKQYVWQEQQ